MATRIKKNDTVVVRSGKDKGKEGKVWVRNNHDIKSVADKLYNYYARIGLLKWPIRSIAKEIYFGLDW